MALLRILVSTAFLSIAYAANQNVFPPASLPYSSNFVEPSPPSINTEFRAHYMQHKYDVDLSHNHIFAGFMYMSPSQNKIRLDGADNGEFQASLFDFSNTTANGTLVSNSIFSFVGGLTSPTCSTYFVPPFILLMTPDILAIRGAVYTGIQKDELYGDTSTWQFTYTDAIVTMFLDTNNILVRYDVAAPGPSRTYATTRFFNIIPGPINATVFETTCH